MPNPDRPTNLRARARTRLSQPGTAAEACTALRVLYNMVLSPKSAAEALALLHELQVHQIELDVQAEEFLATRAEMEEALARQTRLYDSAPTLNFVIDRKTRLVEVNLTAARRLGVDRDELRGQRLDGFLAPHCIAGFDSSLMRAAQPASSATTELTVLPRLGAGFTVYASTTADPDGELFIVAFSEMPATVLA